MPWVDAANDFAGTKDALRAALTPVPPSLCEAAQVFSRFLFERAPGDSALTRVYALVPHGSLPPDEVDAVRELATKTNVHRFVTPRTPVMTLLGTSGIEPDWNHRVRSKGHRAIPLVGSSFVDALPMVSRLLAELGMDITWLDAPDDAFAKKLIGGFNGVFYVADASQARDNQGRLVIPAQDFVAAHGVKTTFGMGGTYLGGLVVVAVVFARSEISRGTVERLSGLNSVFKSHTQALVTRGKLFSGARD